LNRNGFEERMVMMQRVFYAFLHFPKKTLTKHIINQNRLERKGEEKIGLLVSAEKEGRSI